MDEESLGRAIIGEKGIWGENVICRYEEKLFWLPVVLLMIVIFYFLNQSA